MTDLNENRTSRIYLDHAATTPLDPQVLERMMPYLTSNWHNPSSIYVEAQNARRAIDQARHAIASAINCSANELLVTSGGSESDNLAIKGVIEVNTSNTKHVITSAGEHHAVLDPLEDLARRNEISLSVVPLRKDGSIHFEDIEAHIQSDTILISLMHANNEVGTFTDIPHIFNKLKATHERITLHTDAVQSVAHIPTDLSKLHADLVSFTAHKLYGPRGAGALYIKSGTPLHGQILGGGQEEGLRAGTENTAAIVGFASAIEVASERMIDDIRHDRELQQIVITELPKRISCMGITGPKDPDKRLPGHVSCVIGFVEGESILLALDLIGIAASSGSACTTGSIEPSHVLTAMGVPFDLARGSLRLSLGRETTKEAIESLLYALPNIVERLRALSPKQQTPPTEWKAWLDS
ncbi:MAG: cysteine desulfurase family protein [Chloroflexota bacterium]|nr:cysteine desulfurase family protein [Chloroflexota bacterium]